MEKSSNKRDFYLDTVKGLLVIGIVFIHTVFCSGISYIPQYMRNIALCFDVPLFFFVTGCVMSIHPNFNPFKQMYKLALIFLFGVLISQICFLHVNFSQLMQTICFNNADIPKLKVVAGSYWFVPVYIISLLYAKIIIDYLKKWVLNLAIIAIPIFYIFLWFADKSAQISMFGTNIQIILFYLWLILIGYENFKIKNKKIWLYVLFLVLLSILLFLYYIPDLYFQEYKFPVKLPYFILSLFSISTAMFFYRTMKENIFAKIGKNALYYYFSQGIGASVIFYFAKLPIQIWQIKFLLCLGINLLITILLGYAISLIYPKFEKVFLK